MSNKKFQKAFSMIEIVVVLGLIAAVAALSIRISGDMLARSNLVSQLTTIKGMINQSKGFAMTNGVPVRFDYSGGTLLAAADFDLDGTFGDTQREVVIGTWNTTKIDPVDLHFAKVSFVYSNTEALDHWSGKQTSITNFQNDQFIISPLGQIKRAAGTPGPDSGAIFITTDDGFLGAIYISPLGDIKTAIKEPTGDSTDKEWSWND